MQQEGWQMQQSLKRNEHWGHIIQKMPCPSISRCWLCQFLAIYRTLDTGVSGVVFTLFHDAQEILVRRQCMCCLRI